MFNYPSRDSSRNSATHNSNRGTFKFGKVFHGLAVMDKLLGALTHLGEVKLRNDDDLVDKLSRRYAVFLLVLFAIIVSTKQYVGEPINCWVPAQFTESHEEYSNKICWVSDTYYLPFTKKLNDENVEKHRISYYQWVPMILLTQAVLFFAPCAVWRFLGTRSGLSINAIVDAALACRKSSALAEARERGMRYMVNHIDAYLTHAQEYGDQQSCCKRIKKSLSRKVFLICGHSFGNYITALYFFVKFLYIINAVSQLFLLDLFLGSEYHMFGIRVMSALISGETWHPSARFPRVTLCDFEIRTLANVHQHTVQCVLPINLFNEKIFIFVWFYTVLVAILSLFNCLHWFLISAREVKRVRYIRQNLKAMDKISRESDVQVTKFAKNYLRYDGVFIIRMVAKNAGDLIAVELCAALWENYGKERRLLMSRSCKPTVPILAT